MKEVYGRLASVYRGKVVSLEEVSEYLKRRCYEGYDAKKVMEYMVKKGRAFRVIDDIYFVRGYGRYDFEYVPMERIIKNTFEKLGWNNWYFGLYSAWFNGRYAQQVYTSYVIINDRISRCRKIWYSTVKFIKTNRREMFEFGIVKDSWGVPYSDIEKTLLDFLYFSNFGRVPRGIVYEIVDSYFDSENFYMITKGRSYKKLIEYLKYYPKFVRSELKFYMQQCITEVPTTLLEAL